MSNATVRLLGITAGFGVVYMLMGKEHFNFKDPIDPFYFSVSTMSTVGYGDISPQTSTAKYVVMGHQILLLGNIINILLD